MSKLELFIVDSTHEKPQTNPYFAKRSGNPDIACDKCPAIILHHRISNKANQITATTEH